MANKKRFPGDALNDLVTNLQHLDNPIPLLKSGKEPHVVGGAERANRAADGRPMMRCPFVTQNRKVVGLNYA